MTTLLIVALVLVWLVWALWAFVLPKLRGWQVKRWLRKHEGEEFINED